MIFLKINKRIESLGLFYKYIFKQFQRPIWTQNLKAYIKSLTTFICKLLLLYV